MGEETPRAPSFPLRRGADGRVVMAEGDSLVHEQVAQVLGTPIGSRVMRPTFGCRVHERVFEPLDDVLIGLIEADVKDALNEWVPGVEVLSVTPTIDRKVRKARFTVAYRVRATKTRREFVGDLDLRS